METLRERYDEGFQVGNFRDASSTHSLGACGRSLREHPHFHHRREGEASAEGVGSGFSSGCAGAWEGRQATPYRGLPKGKGLGPEASVPVPPPDEEGKRLEALNGDHNTMTLDAIRYEPRAEITFLPEEAALVLSMTQAHYDGECRKAASPGGFLYRLRTVPQASLTFRQVDTLAKILEMPPPESGPIWHLRATTRRILNEMNRSLLTSVGGKQ